MTAPSLVVLKFGGSVLRDGGEIPGVVREVARHLATHDRVIAVVSAFKHHTDVLEKTARSLCVQPSDDALAFYMGLGEMRSAGELTLALQGAGIPATVRMPWDVWLLSSGSPLDAVPVAVSGHRFLSAFRDHRVIVFPGFIGRGRDGRPHLLGRGGSDLTAIFLAAELRADRCVLLKDAPGIFEWAPRPDGPRPRRYTRMSWEDAIALDTNTLKPSHIEYARSRSVTIEVTSPGASSGTIVASCTSEFAPLEETRRPVHGPRE